MTLGTSQAPLENGTCGDKASRLMSEKDLLPQSRSTEEKAEEIEQACEEDDVDKLVNLADSSGGLLNDSLRRLAWPVLLGCQKRDCSPLAESPPWTALPAHRDEAQVRLDVDRAFVYYPNNESEKTKSARKEKLFDLIVSVLRRHPVLYYFQGFHDIAQVLLLVLGEEAAPAAVARISLLRIRDFMLPSMAQALKHLQLLPAILKRADPPLAARLSPTDPYFAISATLTLYAHDVEDYGDIARLFDFILAHEPVMSLYLFAAIIISRRSELLAIPEDESDMLNFQLSKLPQPLDLDSLISQSLILFHDHPPETLPGFIWWRLSNLSVLKTTRSLKQAQTLEHAEDLFRQQSKQLDRQKQRHDLQRKVSVMLRRNKRPVASVTAAVAVCFLGFWMRKTGNDKAMLALLAGLLKLRG